MNHAVVTSLATVTSFPWPTVMPDRLPRILELWGQSHLVDVGDGDGTAIQNTALTVHAPFSWNN